MRRSFLQRRMLAVLFATSAALCPAGLALAQVESLDPNPTMPYDMSRENGTYRSSRGGIGLGRGPSVPGQAREENPAETLLRDIEGTNYGRYTGRAIFPQGVEGRKQPAARREAPAGGVSRAAAAPSGGRPENRWRYRFFQGRWWYWTSDHQWSYFNGVRWTPYRPG
ncbi:MAG TPA: hypothetical protein VNH11_11700 [Pirellulales bacterium]|nr:hypothetical protein [Pirellulales bacterium]